MAATISHSLRVPFGLKGRRMVSPDQVESGLACGCICPGCQAPLIAKKGMQVVWHFAHDGAACDTGLETAVHLMAKQILAEERRVCLPAVDITIQATDAFGMQQVVTARLAPAASVQYDTVALESRQGSRIPDAVGTCVAEAREHHIEVYVRHAVDDKKAQELEAQELVCFEIRLNDVPENLSYGALREAVINAPERIHWISYPGQQEAKRRLKAQLQAILDDARERKAEQDKEDRQVYASLAEEEREERAAWRNELKRERELRQKQAQQAQKRADANARFKASTEGLKRSFVRTKLRLEGDEIPSILNASVRGDASFGVHRHVWQADIFRVFIIGGYGAVDSEFSLDKVFVWLQSRYSYTAQFADSGKVALWDYFSGLEKQGYVRHVGRQRFRVLKDAAPWLEPADTDVLRGWFWAPGATWLSLADLVAANATLSQPIESHAVEALHSRVKARHDSEEPVPVARTVWQRTGIEMLKLLELLLVAGAVTNIFGHVPSRNT
jgi:hypothetical protein